MGSAPSPSGVNFQPPTPNFQRNLFERCSLWELEVGRWELSPPVAVRVSYSAMPFTVTRDLMLPSTVTGSWPRPRWFDMSMWAQAARHLHDGRPLPREVSGRARRRHQRRGARRPRHPHARRLPLRRGLRRAIWHHYPIQRWAGFEGDSPAIGGDPLALAAVPARHAAQRNLHRLALAARHRQDRAPSARLREDLAHRPEQDAQARPLRHLLLAGHGPVPRHPHPQVQGQPRGRLGHGRGDEQGTARAPRRRLPLHPDRRADAALHGQHLRREGREGEVHDRLLQPRGAGPGRRRDLDSHLLGQPRTCSG